MSTYWHKIGDIQSTWYDWSVRALRHIRCLICMCRVLVQRGEEEERTAGSDQKIRYSSGGPISLDPRNQVGISSPPGGFLKHPILVRVCAEHFHSCRKIRLIEWNAKDRYLKKLTCIGTLRQVFYLSEAPSTPMTKGGRSSDCPNLRYRRRSSDCIGRSFSQILEATPSFIALK